MFKNLRLKYRILLGYSVPLLLSVVVSVVVYNCISQVEQQEALVDKANVNMINMLEMEVNVSRMQASARGYLLRKDEKTASNWQEAMKAAQEHFGALEKTVADAKQQEHLKEIQGLSNQFGQFTQKLMALVDAGKPDEALELYRSGAPASNCQGSSAICRMFLKKERWSFSRNIRPAPPGLPISSTRS